MTLFQHWKSKNSIILTLFLLLHSGFVFPVETQKRIKASYYPADSTLVIFSKTDNIVLIPKIGIITNYYYNTFNDLKRTKENFESEFESAYILNQTNPDITFNIFDGDIHSGDSIIFSYYTGKGLVRSSEAIDIQKPIISTNIKQLESDKSKNSIGLIPLVLIIAAFLSLLVFFIYYISKRKQRNRPVEPVIPQNENLFKVVEEQKTEKILQVPIFDEIRTSKNYYQVDARNIFSVTAIHEIYISRSIVKEMYDFFRKSLESDERILETGCYFIGRWEYADTDHLCYNISLEYMVEPGDDAVFGEYTLRFGYGINSEVHKRCRELSERLKYDYIHVCWMHSHPGHGLFLSEHDLSVQRGLVYPEAKGRMLAIVLDTNTPDWRMAFITPRMDGSMNNIHIGELVPTFSLDELYEWSRSVAETTIETIDTPPQKYYQVNVNKSNLLEVLFATKAIHGIDDLLYTNNKGLVGYLEGVGTWEGNYRKIIIDDCNSGQTSKGIGCLISDSQNGLNTLIAKYLPIIERYDIFILYRNDQDLRLIMKETNGSFIPDESLATQFSLKALKEWTRRKRI